MAPLLRDIDVTWTLLVLVPLLFAVASWALQMACAFCAVEAPNFWHSMLIVVALAVSNVVVRFFLEVTDSLHGIWGHYLSPVITSGIVIALTLPTPLLTGFGVSVMHMLFCGLIYFGGRQVLTMIAERHFF